MTAAPMHDVKSASAVLADDVICQSFIQSSSTLAYACLLIRRGNYDLAVHVLHSLEAKQASRFKDMVFYLQAQIGIETGEFATVKKRLAPRVHQQPNDMVALSLLECCIYLEFVEWEKSHPQPDPAEASGTLDIPVRASPVLSNSAFGNAEAAQAAHHAAAYHNENSNDTPVPPSAAPMNGVPPAAMPMRSSSIQHHAGLIEIRGAPPQEAPAPFSLDAVPQPAAPAHRPAPQAPAQRVHYAAPSGTAQDGDFGLFQTLANDVNTQALVLWNPDKSRFKSTCRNPQLEGLVAMLPHEVPMPIQAACSALDCGIVNKICFSFQTLTVTSFHSGQENLGLITGNINQSLLTIVRAENTFRKQAASVRPVEMAPNE